MKNKSTKITLLFVLFYASLAIASYLLLRKIFPSQPDLLYYGFMKDIGFIFLAGIIFKYVLTKNDRRNNKIFESLQKSNDEIRESNERYDIVAKATSDTIWDWKIQEDDFVWNKGIQDVFGYNREDVGKTSKWWFDRIHPEDSIKMSIKLYSFLFDR